MATAKTGGEICVIICFTSGLGDLATGANAIVQAKIAKNDWTNYTQTDDYSFNSLATTFLDWIKVIRYISGALQWGGEL